MTDRCDHKGSGEKKCCAKKLPDLEGIEMKLSELHYIQLLDEARQEILTKGDNTTHYLKEIESRLSAGEEAIKKVAELEKGIKKWEDSRDGVLLSSQTKNYKIMELEKEVERLKADKRELAEALEKIVLEFNQEANYLLKNSVGSDISVGNTYKECAKILKAAVAKHKEAL